jgi:hypothetical protein
MNKTTVVNIKKEYLKKRGYKDFQDWAKDPSHVYIGRDMTFYVKGTVKSKWSNPYTVKKYGIDKCLELYESYIRKNKKLMNDIEELRNKELGCWCITKTNNKCHGNVLIKILEEKNKK